MTAAHAPASFRASISPANIAALLLWAASLAVLFLVDGEVSCFPFAVAGYTLYLGVVGAWLLPKSLPAELESVLCARATGWQLAARCGIVLMAILFVYTDDVVAVLQSEGTAPALSPFLVWVRSIRVAPKLSGYELYNFGTYALIPGILLLTLGAPPRELGLCLPKRGTFLGSLVCLLPVISFVGWGVATGRLSAGGLFWLVIHNLFSNGFTEELLCRGMVLPHLRAFLKTSWAQLGQAIVFALLHFHPAGAEEQANPYRCMAEALALNMPVAMAFGFLALRSRSLFLPTLLHMFRWLP